MSDSTQDKAWLFSTAQKVGQAGGSPIPVRLKDGEMTPAPFKSAQQYGPHHPKWTHKDTLTDVIGVRLGAYILLDYDGNKGEAIPLPELESLLGVTLGEPHQSRADGSYHWLFKRPEHLKSLALKQNAIGKIAPGVDLMTGNQIQYLKAGKTLLNDRYPALSELPDAPQAIIDILTPQPEPEIATVPATSAAETSYFGNKILEICEAAIAESLDGERLATFNKQALKIGRYVAGGEIHEAEAVERLTAAALARGLGAAEVKRSIRTAFKKGQSKPQKAPPLRREQNQSVRTKATGKPAAGVIAAIVPPPAAPESIRTNTRHDRQIDRHAQATGGHQEQAHNFLQEFILSNEQNAGNPAEQKNSAAFENWEAAEGWKVDPEILPAIKSAWLWAEKVGEPTNGGPDVNNPLPWVNALRETAKEFAAWAHEHNQTLAQVVECAAQAGQTVREFIAMVDADTSQDSTQDRAYTQDMGDREFEADLVEALGWEMTAAEGDRMAQKHYAGKVWSRSELVYRLNGEKCGVVFDDDEPHDVGEPPEYDEPEHIRRKYEEREAALVREQEREQEQEEQRGNQQSPPPGKPSLEPEQEAAQEPPQDDEPEELDEPHDEQPAPREGQLIKREDVPQRLKHGPDGMTDGQASFLVATAGEQIAPFEDWNGKTGNPERDFNRGLIATALLKPLSMIPPVVEAKKNKDGDITRYDNKNHIDNYMYMNYRHGITVARNLLTFDFEVFNNLTGEQITSDEDVTLSKLIGNASEMNMPDRLVTSHMSAAAKFTEYHPIERLLYGRKWDGVQRVQPVFDCVPVAPEDEAHRDTLLRGLCLAAIAAIDDGSVSIKYVPTLYSKANDWRKTQFAQRIFDIIPGAFREGLSIDPKEKDSVRNAVFCWGGELGELDGMTKGDSARLKSFVPRKDDAWRPEFGKTQVIKKRQTVFIGTVNKPKFLKDETMASRFPVIALTGPIEIDRINEILGWEFTDGAAKLVNQELLIQFWLEIRAMRAAGQTHILADSFLAKMKASNDQYVDRGDLRDSIIDAIQQMRSTGAAAGNPFTKQTSEKRFTINAIAEHFGIRLEGNKREQIGKILTGLVDEGILSKVRTRQGQQYEIVWAMFDTPDDAA